MHTLLNRYSDGNRTECRPIRSVIITSHKKNWMGAERESNLFSQVMITDKIGRHENLLQIYYHPIDLIFCTFNELHLYFQLSETT